MKIGAAEIDITPDFVTDLSGYASRQQPSIGVLDPIFARAIYLDDGDEKLLWIGCDVVAFERDLVEKFRAWAVEQLKLQPRQVLLSATHTHSAPATIHLNACGQYSEPYVALLEAKLREVAKRAVAKTESCEVVAGRTTLDLAVDRRNKPTAHVDPYVWAIGFRRADGEYLAAAVNYTMHAVAFGHGQRRISPDWCGAAADIVSSSLAGNPIALISNGAAGNINPPASDQPAETVREYGEIVGRCAIGALASAKAPFGSEPQGRRQATSLRVKSITVPLPLEWHEPAQIDRIADEFLAGIKTGQAWERPFQAALSAWRSTLKSQVAAGGAREVPIELQAIRIGDVTIIAVNGEMFTRFTDILRHRVGEQLFVVAYANSAFGYIPTRQAYAEGGYEVETAHFFYNSFRPRPGGLELLADRAVELVKSL